MRHLKKGRKLGRERNQRKALLRGLAVNLITYGKMQTTLPKAKELRPFVERLVSYAKRDTDVQKMRQLAKILSVSARIKLVKEIAPKYFERKGGYTRITKGAYRKGDSARKAFIEFV